MCRNKPDHVVTDDYPHPPKPNVPHMPERRPIRRHGGLWIVALAALAMCGGGGKDSGPTGEEILRDRDVRRNRGGPKRERDPWYQPARRHDKERGPRWFRRLADLALRRPIGA